MRGRVQPHTHSSMHTVVINEFAEIDDNTSVEPSLYYVKNTYNDDYYGQSVTLYRYKIIKATDHYYTIGNGQRLHRNLTGNHYATTPSEALRKALRRGSRYFDILIRRAEHVSKFLKAVDADYKKSTKDLRDFATIAAQFKDVDEIPPALLKDYDLDGKLKDHFG